MYVLWKHMNEMNFLFKKNLKFQIMHQTVSNYLKFYAFKMEFIDLFFFFHLTKRTVDSLTNLSFSWIIWGFFAFIFTCTWQVKMGKNCWYFLTYRKYFSGKYFCLDTWTFYLSTNSRFRVINIQEKTKFQHTMARIYVVTN